MTQVRQPARRRKAPFGRRLRAYWFPMAISAALVAAAVTFAVRWPGFAPSSITVVGNVSVPSSQIVQRAAVAHGINVWLQNTHAMAMRVGSIPKIAHVHVYRVPPSEIVIAVSERAPFAIVDGSVPAVVDRDLRVLDDAPADLPLPRFELPSADIVPGAFLTQAKARAMRDDYETMIAAHVVPLALEYDRYDGLVATMRGGVRVLLGDDADLDRKLPLVDPILAQIVRRERRVVAVDLRAPRTPVLVFRR